MFIKETGYIELICYAKYAGVDLEPEIYPVSYTHLDVYKRQTLYGKGKNPFIHIEQSFAFGVYIQLGCPKYMKWLIYFCFLTEIEIL